VTTSPGWAPPSWSAHGSPGWSPRYTPDWAISYAGIPLWTDHTAQVQKGQWGLTLQEVEGWDGMATRTDTVDLPGMGSLPGMTDYAPRTVTLSGLVIASHRRGPGSIADAAEALTAIYEGVLASEDQVAGVRWAAARTAKLAISRQHRYVLDREVWAPYTWTLVCDDPRRFSRATLAIRAGVVQVRNRGTAPAHPLLALPPGKTTIVHPRGTLTLNLPSLPSGARQWLADCDRGTIWSDSGSLASRIGVDWLPTGVRRDGLWRGVWPTIPAGVAQRWEVTGPGGVVTRHEAWL